MASPQFSDYLLDNPNALIPGLFIAITAILTRVTYQPFWLITLGIAWIVAGLLGQVTPLGCAWPALMTALIYVTITERIHMIVRVLSALGFLVVGALAMLHILPGFRNPLAIDQQLISDDGIPFSMNINLDKSTMGILLLGIYLKPIPLSKVGAAVVATVCPFFITPLVLIGVAYALDFVVWDPKVNDVAWLFCLNNLFLVCVGEEALFRGFLQKGISIALEMFSKRFWKIDDRILLICKGLGLFLASIIFGAAHFAGGTRYVFLSFLAGLGYGVVYLESDEMTFSIVCHFLLNATHYFLFTYPALAN